MWHHLGYTLTYAAMGALAVYHVSGDEFVKAGLYALLALIALIAFLNECHGKRQ
jgi:hypothetical protein